jgi:signal transduction histidine kinase
VSQVVGVVAAGLVGLTLLDILLGVEFFGVVMPALVADVAVLGSVGLATISPPRWVAVATVGGSLASVAVSLFVRLDDSTDDSLLMGTGAWPGFAELAGLGLLTAWSVRSTPRREAIAGAAAFGVAMFGIAEWRNEGRYEQHLLLVWVGAWIAVVGAGWYLRGLDARQRAQERNVRQQERLNLARELHDVVAHHVTGIVVQAQAAQLVAERQPDAAQRALDRIEQSGVEALSAMRSIVGALRDESADAGLQPSATLDDLRAMETSSPGDRSQLAVRLTIDERAESLPGPVIASVHRIAREAVTNARRHAVGASNIEIAVRCDNGVVHLEVVNDGGPASRSPGGFGLRGMAERAAAMGGVFDAGPLPQGGWRVAAELPVAAGTRTSEP